MKAAMQSKMSQKKPPNVGANAFLWLVAWNINNTGLVWRRQYAVCPALLTVKMEQGYEKIIGIFKGL